MIPALFFVDFNPSLNRLVYLPNLFNILYLGVGASALCFVIWNLALKVLGVVKTTVYIYMVPVITIASSAVILHERITWIALLGTALTLMGLFLSENKVNIKLGKSQKTEMDGIL